MDTVSGYLLTIPESAKDKVGLTAVVHTTG